MNLRDQIAVGVLQHLMAVNPAIGAGVQQGHRRGFEHNADYLAFQAYVVADAMLKARAPGALDARLMLRLEEMPVEASEPRHCPPNASWWQFWRTR